MDARAVLLAGGRWDCPQHGSTITTHPCCADSVLTCPHRNTVIETIIRPDREHELLKGHCADCKEPWQELRERTEITGRRGFYLAGPPK